MVMPVHGQLESLDVIVTGTDMVMMTISVVRQGGNARHAREGEAREKKDR